MYAKKSLGQHFLRSTRALDKIIEAGEIKPEDTILEIGPGTGALTERLLATEARIIAIEKDDELFKSLSQKYSNLELIHGDILDLKIEKLKIENYKLIANIPYNITGAILEKFLSALNQPERMVVLVQKEVAKRIMDTKESILSLSVKAYGKPKYVETVLAGSFVPMPNVDSAILAINEISKEFFKEFDEKSFFEVLKTGFKSKRKKLSSNLATQFDKKKVKNAFQKLGLDPNLRAEDAELNTWKELTLLLY